MGEFVVQICACFMQILLNITFIFTYAHYKQVDVCHLMLLLVSKPGHGPGLRKKSTGRAGPEKIGPGPEGPARKFIPHFAPDWLNFYKKSRKNF